MVLSAIQTAIADVLLKSAIPFLWNILRKKTAHLKKLQQRNVDFGGGLERLTATTLGSDDVFLADTLYSTITEIERLTGKKYVSGAAEGEARGESKIIPHRRRPRARCGVHKCG